MTDPRTDDPAESFNERVQDRTIRHMVYLERLKTMQARKAVEFIDSDIIPDLINQLSVRLSNIEAFGFDRGPETTRRIAAMIDELGHITARFKDINTRIQGELFELALDEVEWQRGMMNHEAGFSLNTVTPQPEQIRIAITATPFDGRTLEQWFDRLADSAQAKLSQAVGRGVVEGQTSTQIVRQVQAMGVLGTSRAQTAAVVQSAFAHASNAARLEVFNANADIIKGLQWIATLDSRTCMRCAPLDGKVYPLNKGPRPPIHVNCRCAIAPVTKSFKELGIDAKDVPAKYRASMNGQVPAELTYNQWLRKQSASVQADALGATRAQLFRRGELDVSAFTNNNRRELTLAEIRKRERGAFEKAGL